MKIPDSGRRKALIIVDVQPSFLKPRNKHVIKNIQRLLGAVKYDMYVNSVFSTKGNSVWKRQMNYELPKKEKTVSQILELLAKDTLHLVKSTKSAFRNDEKLMKLLNRKRIQEVHVVGLVTDDCVLATAFDAFDSKFITYVIEECVDSSTKELHEVGLMVLRKQCLTNHSARERIRFAVI